MAANRLAWWLYKVTLMALVGLLTIVWIWDLDRRHDWQLATQQDVMEGRLRVGAEWLNAGPLDVLLAGRDADAEVRSLARAAVGQVAVYGGTGQLLAASQPTANYQPESAPDLAAARHGHIGTWHSQLPRTEEDAIYVSMPILRNGQVVATLRLVQTVKPEYRPPAAGALQWLSLAALVMLIAGVASRLITRRIDQAMRHLHGAIDSCRDGHLQQPAQHLDAAEFEPLAVAINEMAATLERQLLDLTRQTGQWHALFTNMREGLVAVDRDMRVMTVNRAAAELLAFDWHASLQGRSLYEVVRHADLQNFVEEMMRPERDHAEREIQVTDSGGSRILAVSGVRMADESAGVLVVMKDITRLRQLESMRKEFVANVSHEIKTPITSIKGYVETLQDCIPDDPANAARFAAIIHRQADHLNAIVEDLLYLSRLEQGDPTVYTDFAMGNLRGEMANAVSLCQGAADAKEIVLKMTCPDISFRANHRLLGHAILNLVDNAVKYSPAKTTVTLGATVIDGRVLLTVGDQGPGIPERERERIFERFYRLDKSRNRKMGGTGLGLAIVKHIVRLHRGDVQVSGTPGVGSTFTISLPLEHTPTVAESVSAT